MTLPSRIILLPLIAACTVAGAPPIEPGSESQVLAERRLRACLWAHRSRQADLTAATIAVRAACKPQIDDVRDVRVHHASAGLAPEQAQIIERRVTRRLGDEIAVAVANLNGLPHAQN